MNRKIAKVGSLSVVAAALLVGACASNSDVDELRTEIRGLQEEMKMVREDSAKASKNAEEAADAARAAADAAEKSRRIFQHSLRK